jgi:hypothetical protein
MREYMNEVWDIVDNLFMAFNIYFVPRYDNQREEYLSLDSSTFRPPIGPNFKYEVEVRNKTTIPDNLKHW